MRTTLEKIEQFADRMDKNLRGVERSKTSMRMWTRCHLNVVLERCGIERRGERNVALIEAALARRRLYASPVPTDPAVGLEEFLYFLRTPPDPSQPAHRKLQFPVERELENFVWANFEYLFPNLKPFKRQYPLASGSKIDIMAVDNTTGGWVVIELKLAQHDRGTPSQIVGYMDEVRAYEEGRKRARGVRGIVISSEPNESLTGHVVDLAAARNFDIECFVCQVEMDLIPA